MTNSTTPSVIGEPVVDRSLTVVAGSWRPAPDEVEFQWLADGVPVEGATGEQLTPGPKLVGRTLSVRVIASRAGYTTAALTSAATSVVRQAEFTQISGPLLAGTPRLGQALQLTVGSTAPEHAPTVMWLRDGEMISGANGTSYALIADDLGTRISAVVRRERSGYVPAEARTLPTSRVKATPTLDVRVRTRAHRVRIRADVTVPEGAPLPSHVWVRTGKARELVALVDGTAITVLTGLPAGTRTIRVVIPPTRTVAAAAWTDVITLADNRPAPPPGRRPLDSRTHPS